MTSSRPATLVVRRLLEIIHQDSTASLGAVYLLGRFDSGVAEIDPSTRYPLQRHSSVAQSTVQRQSFGLTCPCACKLLKCSETCPRRWRATSLSDTDRALECCALARYIQKRVTLSTVVFSLQTVDAVC
eukprot:2467036-Pyramimonas_sp.AAC.1